MRGAVHAPRATLATDDTPHLPVMQHAVEWLPRNDGYRPTG